jgi:broad specificity phosphatase PhoE
MTGPAVDIPTSQPGAAGVTFDEMEQQLKAAEATILKPDLTKVTLEGDDVPAELKGKSASEALARIKELERVLQLSEQGRQQAMLTAQSFSERSAAPPVQEPVVVEPLVTAQQVADAFAEDTAKGVELMMKMQQQSIDKAADQYTQRIQPLLSGTVSSAENYARQKYPEEFEIYKDEIAAMVKQLPNKNVLSTPEAWDDLVAYTRGKNPQKLFDKMQDREREKHKTTAQEEQRQNAGFTSTGGRAPAPTTRGVVIDDTVREICRVQGISEEDYIKWSRVG